MKLRFPKPERRATRKARQKRAMSSPETFSAVRVAKALLSISITFNIAVKAGRIAPIIPVACARSAMPISMPRKSTWSLSRIWEPMARLM